MNPLEHDPFMGQAQFSVGVPTWDNQPGPRYKMPHVGYPVATDAARVKRGWGQLTPPHLLPRHHNMGGPRWDSSWWAQDGRGLVVIGGILFEKGFGWTPMDCDEE